MDKHNMNKFFGMEGFTDESFCSTNEADDELWISSPVLKAEFAGKYVVHNLIERAISMGYPKVIVPTPTPAMKDICRLHGFDASIMMLRQPDGSRTQMPAMIWDK